MQDIVPTVQDQIASMRTNGIHFERMSSEEAAVFLTDRNFFFKVKAFDKNFDKYTKQEDPRCGKYINLDFAYLVDLSRKDALLREAILDLALDLEHYLKVTVNRVIMEARISTRSLMQDFFNFSRDKAYSQMLRAVKRTSVSEKAVCIVEHAQALIEACRNDDGNEIVAHSATIYDIAYNLNSGIDPEHIGKSIAYLSTSFYSQKLVEKYGDLDAMEPWHFMEMASFGDFIGFYKYFFFDSAERKAIERHPETETDATTAKFIKKLLFPAKVLRNAAAHNDCLLNSLRTRMRKPIKQICKQLIDSYGLNAIMVDRSWQTPVIHDLTALLLSYDRIVPQGETKQRAGHTLNRIQMVMANNSDFFSSQEEVKNSLTLISDMAGCFSERFLSTSS